nr:MAG TPA: hypothetical protein [Caudoviricetes sp.]
MIGLKCLQLFINIHKFYILIHFSFSTLAF